MKQYKLLGKAGEGTFADVLRVQHETKGTRHAMKVLKVTFSSFSQVESLREVQVRRSSLPPSLPSPTHPPTHPPQQALRRLSPHPHIIALHDLIFEQHTGRLALILELMDCNLYDVVRGRRTPLAVVRVASFFLPITHPLIHLIHPPTHPSTHRNRKPSAPTPTK